MKKLLLFGGFVASLAGCSAYGIGTTGGTVFTASNPIANANIVSLLRELVQDTTHLDQDVKNNSSILISQWNMQQKANALSGAQLLPSGLAFLWESSGYQYTSDLAQQSENSRQQVMQAIAPEQCKPGYTDATSCQQAIESDPVAGILIPQNVNNMPADTANVHNAYGQTSTVDNSQQMSLQTQLVQLMKTLPKSYARRLMGEQDSLVTYALAQIMASNSQAQGPSINTQLKQAIMRPFSAKRLPKTGKTWLQTLSTASTPQLLRMITVQLAMQNYLTYQQYRLAQTQQMIHITNISKLVELRKAIGKLASANSDNTEKMTTALYQLDRDIQQTKRDR